jgi:hypothetical protein
MWELLAPPYDSYTIAIFPIFIASLMVSRQYFRTRYDAHRLMALCWFWMGLFYLLNVLGYIYWSRFLMILSTFLWIPIGYSMIFLIDSISRDNIDFIKVGIISCFSTLLVYTGLQPDAISTFPLTNGQVGWDWAGFFRISVYIITTCVGISWTYYCVKIWMVAPPTMKRAGFWLMVGALFIGVIPLVLFVTGVILVYLGIEGILMSIGALINAIVFYLNPKIILILPFKVQNLTVLSTHGGVPLFRYYWVRNPNEVDELLFSGMVQGIKCILNEAVNQGDVQEIKMKSGSLIIEHDQKTALAFVMVASKRSLFLHKALQNFKVDFIAKFKNNFNDLVNIDKYQAANDLIEKHFDFIQRKDHDLEN